MASVASARTQTPKTAPQFQLAALRSHVYTMAAAFAGVIFGVLGSMGFVGSYLHSQFAAENAALSSKVVSMTPTAETTASCAVPTDATAQSAGVKTAAAVMPASAPATANAPVNQGGGKGGDGGSTGSGPTTFVSQMVHGTISNTGPDSTNTITGTNSYQSTVTNNNNVKVTNENDQSAHSGSATTSNNTQGGSASTGDASNVNSSSTSISIKN